MENCALSKVRFFALCFRLLAKVKKTYMVLRFLDAQQVIEETLFSLAMKMDSLQNSIFKVEFSENQQQKMNSMMVQLQE